MTKNSLDDFYTLIVMYVKGDLGSGEYFLALAREIYERLRSGVRNLADDISSNLPVPSGTRRIRSKRRNIVINHHYEIQNSIIIFDEYRVDFPEWEGADFFIEVDNQKLLIPNEVLDSNNEIRVDTAKREWPAINQFTLVSENL